MNPITSFTVNDVTVGFANAQCVSIDQGGDTIEMNKNEMVELCVQFLALNKPELLKFDKE